MKIVVILMLLAILGSLFSALFFLYRDQSGSTRTVKALSWRIGLSIGLFIVLLAGYYVGWFRPGQ